jgi:threonine dehydrogenase-like Zn-dependent dehydrogenase
MEAHVTPSLPDTVYDRAKQMLGLETDRPHVLREMIYVCRPAGVISIPGVYAGFDDKFPMGQLMNKGLTVRTGQTHVNRWTDDLLHRIEQGQIDPSFVITHTVGLEDGPKCTRSSATSRMAASRWFSSLKLERSNDLSFEHRAVRG